MAIHGKFNVKKPEQNLRTMKMGVWAYVSCDGFILSKSLLCIPADTEVFYNIESLRAEGVHSYIAIQKKHHRFDHNSFDINLGADPDFDAGFWLIAIDAVTRNYKKHNDWLCFPNPPIYYEDVPSFEDYFDEEGDPGDEFGEDVAGIVSESDLDVQELARRLDQAVSNEDYKLAAQLRDELIKKNNRDERP